MSIKRIWAMPPEKLTTKTGKNVLVGVTTIHDTGKRWKGSGAKERERASKRAKRHAE